MERRDSGPMDLPPYSFTARLYDELVGRWAFESWRENFLVLERRYGLNPSRCLDAACGTGYAAAFLAERGWKVYGVDRSPHMLSVAAERVSGKNVVLLRQDMRFLVLPEKVELVVCATDSLNHLLVEKDLAAALRSFASVLHPGGYLLADLNTPWQLRRGGDEKPWPVEVRGKKMTWESRWDETKGLAVVVMSLEEYGDVRCREVHRERGYHLDTLMDLLKKSGFIEVEVMDARGLVGIGKHTRRWQVAARRG